MLSRTSARIADDPFRARVGERFQRCRHRGVPAIEIAEERDRGAFRRRDSDGPHYPECAKKEGGPEAAFQSGRNVRN